MLQNYNQINDIRTKENFGIMLLKKVHQAIGKLVSKFDLQISSEIETRAISDFEICFNEIYFLHLKKELILLEQYEHKENLWNRKLHKTSNEIYDLSDFL